MRHFLPETGAPTIPAASGKGANTWSNLRGRELPDKGGGATRRADGKMPGGSGLFVALSSPNPARLAFPYPARLALWDQACAGFLALAKKMGEPACRLGAPAGIDI
jgi:hypothetical protein